MKVVITGANGTIGTVLQKGLASSFEITPIIRSQADVRDFSSLVKIFPGHDAVIHLAWNMDTDNFGKPDVSEDNTRMTYNVYQAALETGVKRVIMASSVHANFFFKKPDGHLISPNSVPTPDSPYGAHKVFMESLGRYFATKGLEIICIRFGGVNKENKPFETKDSQSVREISERAVFLSHKDCVTLVQTCVKAEKVPDNFVILYGISDNKNRLHDISNPFGWTPQDNHDKI